MQTPKTLKGRGARYAEFYDAADEAELEGAIVMMTVVTVTVLKTRLKTSYDDSAWMTPKGIEATTSRERECPKTRGANPSRYVSAELRRAGIVSCPRRSSGGGTYSVRRSSITTARSLTSRPALDITQLGETRTSQYAISSSGSMDMPGPQRSSTGKVAQMLSTTWSTSYSTVETTTLWICCTLCGWMISSEWRRLSTRREEEAATRPAEWEPKQRRPTSRATSTPRINSTKRKQEGDRRDDRRDDRREYRRDDRRTRREDGRDRRVTVAVTSDDEEGDKVECQPSRRLGQLDYDDDDSDYGRDGYLDSEEESDHGYIDAGLANEKSRSGNSRVESARPQRNSARTQWNSTGPQGDSARQQPNSSSHWNPANAPPDRHSRSAEPVTEAKYIFAYVGEAERPEDEKKSDGNGSDTDGIDGELGYSDGESPAMMSNADTLGWEVSYEFEVWVMDHHAGVNLILGTDFMIPAGIRLDLYNSLAKLPDEVVVPLIKSQNLTDDPRKGLQITDGPTETICLPGRLTAEFRIRRRQPAESTHELWVRRTKDWIPTVVLNRSGRATRVLLTSVKPSLTWCPAHFPVLNWTPHGILPPEGFVRLSSAKYRDWQTTKIAVRGNPPDRGRRLDEIEVSDEVLDADPEKNLHLRYLLAAELDDDGNGDSELGEQPDTYERTPNSLAFEDYAHELAFLPDLTDAIPTQLDYSADNVVCGTHSDEQTTRLVKVLQSHERIMISSGNALPPPAYGVVCDIDVQGHRPIRQRARRKNGVDIRLCINYKLVNAITLMMEYAMPLVDDLLTELDAYLWFCSLDAASGFWAVMMTRRARWISAFVCALGHFEWLRMPFGLKNAPMIYQRLIDNALWGYVQPKGGWEAFADRVSRVEQEAEAQRETYSTDMTFKPTRLTKYDADRRALAGSDAMQEFIDSPEADMFASGEPDQSSLVPVFERCSRLT
ncbi:unnamed protein product [Phytophthora fragariaefolia]|uniref:Unnamed protein product n=1 Tax=Phytophthora fragariaefolia TaxID=1490495 RepID=A0A9W7CW10_9STRA|nr:unnamed protein product [Phytophthora fragariaefolia]